MSKKALLVGINYRGTSSELKGCINDVLNVRAELIKRGYKEGDILLLTDDTPKKPTRVNILQSLTDIILSGAETIYFHFSGHGTQVRDTNGDENDGKDECICPIDFQNIIDDELRNVVSMMKANQYMFAVLDSCHSGTGMDLYYTLYKRFGTGQEVLIRDGRLATQTRGQVIMLSGCQDHQYSEDAIINGRNQGALTFSFLKALSGGSLTYVGLIRKVREILRQNRFAQYPNLSAGRSLNLNSVLRL